MPTVGSHVDIYNIYKEKKKIKKKRKRRKTAQKKRPAGALAHKRKSSAFPAFRRKPGGYLIFSPFGNSISTCNVQPSAFTSFSYSESLKSFRTILFDKFALVCPLRFANSD